MNLSNNIGDGIGQSVSNISSKMAPEPMAPKEGAMADSAASPSEKKLALRGDLQSSGGRYEDNVPPAGAQTGLSNKDDNYQGLPAKLTIPNNVHYASFSQGMLDSNSKVQIFGLLISRSITGWLAIIFISYLILELWKSKKRILELLSLQ